MIHGNPIPAASLRQTAVVLSAVLADITAHASSLLHRKAIAATLLSVRETLDRPPARKGKRRRRLSS